MLLQKLERQDRVGDVVVGLGTLELTSAGRPPETLDERILDERHVVTQRQSVCPLQILLEGVVAVSQRQKLHGLAELAAGDSSLPSEANVFRIDRHSNSRTVCCRR